MAAAILYKDVLGMILAKLNLTDHARFSSVCKLWRSVAAENPAMNKPFSLVRSDNPEALISLILRNVFRKPQWREAKFIGSYEGWLVCLILPKKLFLFNIASRTRIRLPNYSASQFHVKMVLSSSPSSSPRDKCLMVLMNGWLSVHFCKLGDTAWTEFRGYKPGRISLRDIIFIKDQLYTIDFLGQLEVFDFGLNSDPTIFNFPLFGKYAYLANAAASDDKLLVIERKTKPHKVVEVDLFKVFEIDPRNSSYIQVESLGDNILFAGPCSLTLSVKDHPEFQPDRLYEDFYALDSARRDGKFSDFSLKDKTLERGGNNWYRCLVFFTLFRRPSFINQAITTRDTN